METILKQKGLNLSMKIFLSKKTAEFLLKLDGEIYISPYLGFSDKKIKIKTSDFDKEKLRKITKTDAVYYFDTLKKEYYKIAMFDPGKHKDAYYQLNFFPDSDLPTLTINGFRMQRIDKTPFQKAEEIIEKMKITEKDKILDTCMGLGYDTIQFSKTGADTITCEKSRCVYEIAKINPWSRPLFKKNNIKIIKKDVMDYLETSKEKFDVIIHDPPTVKFSRELYSEEFYELIKKVAKPKTRLFHYFGDLTKSYNLKAFENAEEWLGWKAEKWEKMLGAVFFNE